MALHDSYQYESSRAVGITFFVLVLCEGGHITSRKQRKLLAENNANCGLGVGSKIGDEENHR